MFDDAVRKTGKSRIVAGFSDQLEKEALNILLTFGRIAGKNAAAEKHRG